MKNCGCYGYQATDWFKGKLKSKKRWSPVSLHHWVCFNATTIFTLLERANHQPYPNWEPTVSPVPEEEKDVEKVSNLWSMWIHLFSSACFVAFHKFGKSSTPPHPVLASILFNRIVHGYAKFLSQRTTDTTAGEPETAPVIADIAHIAKGQTEKKTYLKPPTIGEKTKGYLASLITIFSL